MSRFTIHDGSHHLGAELYASFEAAMQIAALGFLVVDRYTNIGYIGV